MIKQLIFFEVTFVVTSIWHAYFPIFLHDFCLLSLRKYTTLKKSILYNPNEYRFTEIFYSFKFK